MVAVREEGGVRSVRHISRPCLRAAGSAVCLAYAIVRVIGRGLHLKWEGLTAGT
ncbi:uncharacterized protein SCHCODRAFT_01309806 [Schizophyllum commune H4-8]|uniref:uncharacterized protein n=1 Tax=Schizophyllum commune (strain H4-8 / FGSC 9210) TaxID=578458 RepID=UPI00215E0D85|nr:uncharacterized protein SCHCODRAFT_01309806 [Schizophyllum commune H4-8]KAI5891385.1 hypothetical protein SCHCODRAFT_01309806 [Schizophyllum commune H4-8]